MVLVLTALIAAAIAVGTLLPSDAEPGFSGRDKLAHLGAFALLVLPAAVGAPRLLPVIAAWAILFGGAIELVQPWVGRSREGMDWLADAGGVGVAVMAGGVIRHLRGTGR